MRGVLTDEQIDKLEAVGMRWQDPREAAWMKFYIAAKPIIVNGGGADGRTDCKTRCFRDEEDNML